MVTKTTQQKPPKFINRKRKIKEKKLRRKRIIIFLLVLFFIVISCFLYVNDYYPSDLSVQEYLQKKELVSVIEIEEGYYFDGIGETDAMIFYPGAKVEYTAYLPFLYQLAEQGMD